MKAEPKMQLRVYDKTLYQVERNKKMKVFCEYLTNPIGLDMAHPRFSWIVEEDSTSQVAYQISVCDSLGDEVWNTGKVESNETLGVAYHGEELKTAGTYHYMVRVWCKSGKVVESKLANFTMGILETPVWHAPWIGGPGMEDYAFLFRTEFEAGADLRNAYAYVISPNYYVLFMNGERCSQDLLQNANTDPNKTLLYASYPVTSIVKEGKNAIGVELGNGWGALQLGRTGVGLGEHLFSLQLRLEYADGRVEWVDSDPNNWSYTKQAPLKENSIYQGERYDARDEVAGWDEADFDCAASGVKWCECVEFEPTEGVVKAQYLEPIRVVREMKPIAVYPHEDGSYTFDMGQNFAGWARLTVSGPAGTEVKLAYSELEYADHTINQMSLRHMRATDTYVLKGEGVETYSPDFTFHGFRYVQVYGLPAEPTEETIVGCVVRSAVERVGSFSCDNELINKLQSNICWTEESNLHSLPTDCPQRDERLGWINDMTVRNECAMYNYRLDALYTKWLRDIRDTQGKVTGAISDTAPMRVFGCRPADPVGGSLTLLPWNMYLHYGDVRVIEENYEANKKWLGYIERNSTDYIVRWSHMGDWAAPIGDNDAGSIGGGAVSVVTPTIMVATAYFAYLSRLMADMAELIGKTKDADYYTELAVKIKDAFLRHFYNAEEKYVCANSQGANTIALYMEMIPEEDRKAVFENLVKDIVETHNYHLSTGNMCSRYLIEILLENGYEDVAYKLLTQTSYPSWGYEIGKGATTIWERWEEVVDYDDPLSMMASYNHPMYGAVGVSFYRYLAGIRTDGSAGFEKFLVKPVLPTEMHHAQASVETMRGTISSSWTNKDGKLSMEIKVPFNCRATICIPTSAAGTQFSNITMNGTAVMAAGAAQETVNEEDGYLVIGVKAGTYEIECA